ncbi:MAG: winged helix-turn-helix transcriptional regulator [Rhodobacter sp.]|nr:winged helix-turn-helix transcriptional regulator [Rhodobacter sp.]MCA3512696.1 winged helix-turn-helix transcriptional regulator [Rhodobacter sp.]MCA3519788.1 winged helix-turn-helix transcriptional regulator [Rhodobacter sp.]MCA3522563.1 winged helix-turn-helix transcriptional regulator [Rhodobacter sp.]MCA3524986.1 winged helix-turn-helix transcriptional regulator [Rhodobacter sp.]
MERSKVLAALSALASDKRFELVCLLMPRGETGLSAGEIGRHLGMTSSRLSFHLAALEQAGLIRSRRVSRKVFYAADLGGLGQTIGSLLRDCCMDHPEVRACCQPRRPGEIAPTAPAYGQER